MSLLDDDELGPVTDKFDLGYYPQYEKVAAEIGPAGNVLEVGVFRGASLRLWQRLFPQGVIAGVDNGKDAHYAREGEVRWPEGTFEIFADQGDPYVAEAARAICPEGWDLVVDDASHLGSLSRKTFELLWPQVKSGGWYALEDWWVGIPDNDAWGHYEDDSMLRLAQSFVERAGRLESDVTELRYVRGLALARKR